MSLPDPNAQVPAQALPPSTPVPTPPAPKRSFLKPTLIVVALLILALGATAVLAWKTSYLDSYLPSSVKELLGRGSENGEQGQGTYTISAKDTVDNLKRELEAEGFFLVSPEEFSVAIWWTTEEGWGVADLYPEAYKLDLEITLGEAKLYDGKADEHPTIQKIIGLVASFFSKNGFSINPTNTYRPEPEGEEYLGPYVKTFTKGKLVCTYEGHIETISREYNDDTKEETEVPGLDYAVACSDKISQLEEKSAPYARELKKYYKTVDYLGPDYDWQGFIVGLSELGDFAKYSIGNPTGFGGGYGLGKWEGDNFTVVYDGQDTPPCSDMEKYSVPQELYVECY